MFTPRGNEHRMKRIVIIIAAAALLAPAAALANPSSNASRDCTALKAKMGATAFASAYTNLGACVSALTPLERMNTTSAQQLCSAEQRGKKAFGKCVSEKASASSQVVRQSQSNPARLCASVRSQPRNAFGKCVAAAAHAQVVAETSAARLCLTEQTLAGFATHWGTNANLSNAFGMCVSSTAKSIESKS
jgi:hypothetical protein